MVKKSHDSGSIPSRQVIRTGEGAHSIIGTSTSLAHHRTLLAPHKIHSALVHAISATLLPATYNGLFSPKVKSP